MFRPARENVGNNLGTKLTLAQDLAFLETSILRLDQLGSERIDMR
jgi:hypothetical protein